MVEMRWDYHTRSQCPREVKAGFGDVIPPREGYKEEVAGTELPKIFGGFVMEGSKCNDLLAVVQDFPSQHVPLG